MTKSKLFSCRNLVVGPGGANLDDEKGADDAGRAAPQQQHRDDLPRGHEELCREHAVAGPVGEHGQPEQPGSERAPESGAHALDAQPAGGHRQLGPDLRAQQLAQHVDGADSATWTAALEWLSELKEGLAPEYAHQQRYRE